MKDAYLIVIIYYFSKHGSRKCEYVKYSKREWDRHISGDYCSITRFSHNKAHIPVTEHHKDKWRRISSKFKFHLLDMSNTAKHARQSSDVENTVRLAVRKKLRYWDLALAIISYASVFQNGKWTLLVMRN